MGVTGIGGFFFRANDTEALARWYAEHLGVGAGEYGQWHTAAGPSVFAPFKADTDYFAVDKQWMLNLRVEGLDAMIATLRAEQIEVLTDPSWDSPKSAASRVSTIPRAMPSSCGSRHSLEASRSLP